MTRLHLRLLLAALMCALSAWGGWEWRDRSADVTTAERDRDDAAAAVVVIADARAADLAGQADAGAAEGAAIQQQQEAKTEYRYITREVVRYVAANPSPDGCGLDADGLRIWRDASAGRRKAEPDHTPVGDGPVP